MLQIERSLQQEVVLRLSQLPIITIPIPNSTWIPARTAAERALVARIIIRMKGEGFLLPGAPDLALFWHGGAGLIELKRPATRTLLGKAPAGVPTAEQRQFAEACAAAGVNHAYCRSWEEVHACLVEWGAVDDGLPQ